MKKAERMRIIAQNEISEIRTVTLGGHPQKIMIDGKHRSNPVVICLHGGPGSPIPFSVGCRGLFPEITEKFTLVCWDQLGCGINNFPIDDSFSISDFVNMTIELVKAVRVDFPENKIILFGVSWGSILALRASLACGELLGGTVCYGQFLFDMPFNGEVFTALERSKLPPKKKAALKEMERNIQNAKTIMGWLQKYTDGYICRSGEKVNMSDMILGLLRSPDYKLRDFKAILINGYMKNNSLIGELLNIDLRKELSEVKIPYKIIQGDRDLITTTKLLSDFAAENPNENVSLTVIPDNGHIPGKTAMDAIIDALPS